MIKKRKYEKGEQNKPKTTRTPGMDHGAGTKCTAENKLQFLAIMRLPIGNVHKACLAIGIDRRTAYNWRNKDADFAQAWDDAAEDGVDQLEEEARRRGYEGVDKPVSIAGEREVIKEYSDTMLKLILQGRRSKYFANKTEVSGVDGGAIQHEVTVTFVKAKGQK